MPPEGEEDPKLAGTLAGRGDTVTCSQSPTASLHLRLVHLAAQRDISPDGSPASFPRGATGGHGAIPAGRADPRVHLRGRATLPDRHHPHLRERRSVLPAGIPERGSVSGSIGERPAPSRRSPSAASSSRTPRGSAGQPPCHTAIRVLHGHVLNERQELGENPGETDDVLPLPPADRRIPPCCEASPHPGLLRRRHRTRMRPGHPPHRTNHYPDPQAT
jgi:hypothetical protein